MIRALLLTLYLVIGAGISYADYGGCEGPAYSACVLLQRAQNELENNEQLLQDALEEIENGLGRVLVGSEDYAAWAQMKWFYYLLKNDHDSAVLTLTDALAAYEASSIGPTMVAEAHSNMSFSQYYLGAYSLAAAHQREAISLAIEHDLEGLSDYYYGLGKLHLSIGELEVASSYLELANERYVEGSDEFGIAIASNKLGDLRREEGQPTEAVDLHRHSMDYFEESYPYRSLLAKLQWAKDQIALRDLDLALTSALEIWNDPRLLPPLRVATGVVLLEINNEQLALNAEFEPPFDQPSVLAEVHELLFETESDIGDDLEQAVLKLEYLVVAIDHYARQLDVNRVEELGEAGVSIINRIAAGLHNNSENFYAWMAKTQPLFNAYVGAIAAESKERLLEVLDSRYDWRLRKDILRSSNTVSEAVRQEELDRLRALVAAEQALFSFVVKSKLVNQESDTYKLKQQELIESRDLALDTYVGSRNWRSVASAVADEDYSIDEIGVAPIATGDLVLRYFIQENMSFVLALVGNEVHFRTLPPKSVLRKTVESAVSALQRRDMSSHSRLQALSQLSDIVPVDILSAQNGISRLVIVPDDVVHLVPFSSINLIDRASPGYKALGVSYEIVRTNSVAGYYETLVDTKAIDQNGGPDYDLVVMADPEVPSTGGLLDQLESERYRSWMGDLSRLPYTAKEAREIKAIFSAKSIGVYTDKEATREVFYDERTRDARILHIATHGFFDKNAPNVVGLLVSPSTSDGSGADRFFSITELLRLQYTSNLVIISGCETLRGREYNGLGVKSMAQVFLARGAGAAIGTLWKVPDQGSAHFMRLFYRSLAATGGNASLSLKLAKKQMAASRRYADPIYWSGFALDSSNYAYDTDVFQ